MINLKYEKLFGRFDYEIQFNDSGLTIITGPNGFGKSTILKTIEAFSKGLEGILFFSEITFKKITLSIDSIIVATVLREDNNMYYNDICVPDELCKFDLHELVARRSRYYIIDNGDIFDRRDGTRISIHDYLMKMLYKRVESEEISMKDNQAQFISELDKAKNAIGNIYFIKEQRLITERMVRWDETEALNVIDELPKQFKDIMMEVQQRYSTVSSNLDSSYPNRLFRTEKGITEEDYKTKIQEMTNRFNSLKKYNLSTNQEIENFVFKEEHAKALKVYFDDFDIKYKEYEEFIERLDLFTAIINDRLSFKRMVITKEKGISINDDKENEIPLNKLSSGEQQEIVLFYELIFGTQNNILLLIDEPEISLHITWQKRFMDDLLKIIEFKKVNAIVATHSPQIINNHWDLQVDLGELYGNKFN